MDVEALFKAVFSLKQAMVANGDLLEQRRAY